MLLLSPIVDGILERNMEEFGKAQKEMTVDGKIFITNIIFVPFLRFAQRMVVGLENLLSFEKKIS